jgi:hypothetical protein
MLGVSSRSGNKIDIQACSSIIIVIRKKIVTNSVNVKIPHEQIWKVSAEMTGI